MHVALDVAMRFTVSLQQKALMQASDSTHPTVPHVTVGQRSVHSDWQVSASVALDDERQ